MYYKVKQFYYFTLSAFLMLVFFIVSSPANSPKEVTSTRTELISVVMTSSKTMLANASPTIMLSLGWSLSEDFYIAATKGAYQFFASVDDNASVGTALIAFSGEWFPQDQNQDLTLNKKNDKASLENSKKEIAPFDTNVYILYNTFDQGYMTPGESTSDLEFGGEGVVAGMSWYNESAIPSAPQWINVQDSITGDLYCLAIFYGEVNKYDGLCKNEYY